jgi:hypothetical protein
MNNKEPTQEQIKEFWEKCGAKPLYDKYSNGDFTCWQFSNGECEAKEIIPTNLNNLFKYAIPKILGQGYYIEILVTEEDSSVTIKKEGNPDIFNCKHHLELALFWAIWEVIKDG